MTSKYDSRGFHLDGCMTCTTSNVSAGSRGLSGTNSRIPVMTCSNPSQIPQGNLQRAVFWIMSLPVSGVKQELYTRTGKNCKNHSRFLKD